MASRLWPCRSKFRQRFHSQKAKGVIINIYLIDAETALEFDLHQMGDNINETTRNTLPLHVGRRKTHGYSPFIRSITCITLSFY